MKYKSIGLVLVLVSFLTIPVTAAYTVGNGGSAWAGNSTLENTSMNLASHVIVTNSIFQDDFECVLFNNRTNLTIPTYDGSGQAIHPDIYYNATGWNGYKYWMVMTPYPASNVTFENPSIAVSNNGYNWEVPPGLTNPIDPQPPSNYNSDPDFAFKNNTLYAFYREVSGGYDKLKMRNSTDGVNWSNEYAPLELPNYELTSPAIVYNASDDKFYMWYVDTGSAGYLATTTSVLLRNSTDGINWGNAQNVAISIPNRVIWHIHVDYVPEIDEYWMVISAGTTKATTSNELFFAFSTDKLNWTVLPGKIIGLGRNWDDLWIYRSAIKYINSTAKIWYSARNTNNVWATGFAETSVVDLKNNNHWVYSSSIYNKGYFNRSSSQVKTGNFSAKLGFDGVSGQYVDIRRNVSDGQNTSFEIDLYDDGITPGMKLFRVVNTTDETVGIGVWTDASEVNYSYHTKAYGYTVTSIPRTVGWHRFRIFVQGDKSVEYFIDDIKVGTLSSQFDDPIYAQLSGGYYTSNFYVDDLKVYKYTSGNLTTWYDAGTGNETYRIDVNAATPASTNYTVWYRQNGTGEFVQVGGVYTDNNIIALSPRYQNTDVRIVLNGNRTATPELISITFYTKPVSSGNSQPNMTSWCNNKTNNDTITLTLNTSEPVKFNATANQTIETWNWYKDNVYQTTNNFDNYTTDFSSVGPHTIQVNATNENGTSNTITWNLTIIDIVPPLITVSSPVNGTTYTASSVNLNYTVNEATTWEAYNLDDEGNITLGNTTLTGLSNEFHSLVMYANDTAGNRNSTTIYFTVDTTLVTQTVCYGDSITYSWTYSGSGIYPDTLNESLSNYYSVSQEVINEGHGGWTSSGGASYVTTVIANHPDMDQVCLMFGTNDANPYVNTSLSDYKSNMGYMIDAFQNESVEVFLGILPPVCEEQEFRHDRVLILNEILRDLALEKEVYIADTSFYFNDTWSSVYYYDCLHPNRAGYEIMGNTSFFLPIVDSHRLHNGYNLLSTNTIVANDSVEEINVTATTRDKGRVNITVITYNSTQFTFVANSTTNVTINMSDGVFDILPDTKFYVYRDGFFDQNVDSTSDSLTYTVTFSNPPHIIDVYDTYHNPRPNITDRYNNKTNDDSLFVSINISEEVRFNVTADQPVNYNWYKDESYQDNNYDYFTTSWTSAGIKRMSVNATNSNGTSNTITWDITVKDSNNWTVGNGGETWTGNSTMNNVTEDNGDHNVKLGIFADNFEDNNLYGWTTTGGTHTVSNGVYEQQTTAIEWVKARPTSFTYTSPAVIQAKVNVADGGKYLDEGLGWGNSTFDGVNDLFAGRRDYWTQWELRRNNIIDDSDTSSRTLNVWSDLQLYKNSNSYDYRSSYNDVILNTQNSPTSSQYPYLLGSSEIVQYWDDVRIIALDSTNDIVTSGNLTTWYDAGIGKETYQIDVNATTPVNTNYTVWYRQKGTGEFVQVGGVYTDSSTIVLSPGYRNTDVRLALTGNQTATPNLVSITFYTRPSGTIPPNITSWCNNKTNNNSLTLTINTSEPVKFNVTANQTIETWNWYKDNVSQANNFDNYTTDFGSGGPHTIQVNATNGNGTSDTTITWSVSVQEVPGPNITSWCNNKTNNNSLSLIINTSEPVRFNVTANQTIETWNWYKDNVSQANNFDNYTTDFGSVGPHTIQVNATNGNGTSDTITWGVEVKNPNLWIIGSGGETWAGNSTTTNTTEDNGDYNVKLGIFADDFEDNNLNGWTTTGGTHTVSNGVYEQQTTAIEWITARPTSFTYASPAVIQAKVNVADGGTFLDEGLGWGDSTWNPANALFVGRRDYFNQWELRRNDVIDDSDTSSRTLDVWSDLQLYKKSNGYDYHCSYDNIILNTQNSPTSSQFPYLLGSSAIVQYWDDVRIIPLDSNNDIVTSGNLTTWYDAGIGKETYQIDVHATTPANTNYTAWYRQNGTGEFVQVGGVYTDSNTIVLSPRYQNTDVRIVLTGNQTATPELISITFYTQSEINGINLPNITSWCNNKTNNNSLTLTVNTSEPVKFNVTANQTIETWNWYKDNVTQQTNNFDNYTTEFGSVGPHSIQVNATNGNGTSDTIIWTVTVQALTGAPNITSWCNNKTNNNSTTLTVNTSEPVKFNVTANQTIETWNWYKDNVTQPTNNFDNYTTDFGTGGHHTIQVNATNGNGTSDTIIWTVTVQALTGAPNITSWCNNKTNNNSITLTVNTSEPVRFNASANQTIETWNWYKDNVTQPTNNFDNYTTEFGSVGPHSIQVNATNGNGTSDTIIWTVTVQALTGAPNITSWCNNKTNNNSITLTVNTSEPVRFNASANQTIETWNWYKDNVTQPTNNFDNYTTDFGSVGPHSIQVNATNGNGTSDTIIWTVTVQAQAGAPNITSWCNNKTNNNSITLTVNTSEPVRFNASANQTIETWNWYKDNVTQPTNNCDNYTTEFGSVGPHSIQVNATNGNGTSDTIIWTVTVQAQVGAPNITSWGNNKTNNNSITLTVNTSEPVKFNVTANQTIETWNWYKDNVTQPTNNFDNYTTDFGSGGPHTIQVNATNGNGTSDTIIWTVTVQAQVGAPNITSWCNNKTNNNSITLTVNTSEPVRFNASANQTIETWNWYKDNVTQQTNNFDNYTTEFGSVGPHSIRVNATNGNGTSDTTITWSVSVQEVPGPNITSWCNNKTNNNSLSLIINTSEPVRFNVTANQTIETWNWYKDNVSQANNFDNYTTDFGSVGPHTIQVNATNGNGTSDTITWGVEVKNPNLWIIGSGGETWAGNSTTTNTTEDNGDYNVKLGIFADDFEDNNLNGWTTTGGTHTVSNGVYEQQTTAIEWITARPTSFTYASPAVIQAKVNVADGGTFLDEGLGWGDSTWNPANALFVGRRDYFNQWELRRNDVIDDSDTSSRTLDVWSDLQLYKKSNGYDYHCSYDNIILNTQNSPTSSQFPYLLGSSAIVQYWDDVRIIPLDSNNDIVTSGNLTTWYDAGIGKETYQIDVHATTPANTNYTAWYRQNGTGEFVQVGGVYTDSNTIVLSPRYQNTDVRIVLTGNQTATPELISITFYTQSEINGINLPNITSWCNNKTNNNSLTLTVNTSEPVKFNVTANQTIETWNWYKDNVTQQTNNFDNYTTEFGSVGPHSIQVNATNGNGTSDTIIWTVTVQALTGAPNITSWCNNKTNNNSITLTVNTSEPVKFNVTANQTIETWNWYKDNVTQPTNNFDNYTTDFGTGGHHTIQVNATNGNGTSDTIIWTVTVQALTGAPNITSWCNNKTNNNSITLTVNTSEPVRFNASANQTIETWNWYKDNVTQPTNNCDNYTTDFGSVGPHSIQVNATNGNGTSDTIIWTVTVQAQAGAPNITSWCNNKTNNNSITLTVNTSEPVRFNASANQTIETWNWYKDNVTQPTNNCDNYTTEFGSVGPHSIQVNATNGNGTSDTIIWTVTVQAQVGAPNITSWGNNKTNNNSITLTVNTSEPVKFNVTANQTIETWNWYKDNVTQPTNNFDNYTTDFGSGGPHTIQVNATNGNGTSDTIIWTVTVQAQVGAPNITSWCNNKTNNNSITLTVNTSEPVRFNASANQTIETWNWYKDNVTQQTNNFDNYTTEFGSVGPHSIRVNATNGNGTSDTTITWSVSVQEVPGPNITSWCNNKTNNNSLSLIINTSEPVRFNVTANQTIETWNWYKDNVSQANNFDNYTTDFGSVGPHTIQVNATNGNGTSDTITWGVEVKNPNLWIIGSGGETWAGNSTTTNTTEDNGDYNVKLGIFADDFEDNNLNGWTTTGGTHTVSNGVYEQQTTAIEWITARPTSFTYASPAVIQAKVNVADGGTFLDEGLGWGDSTWNPANALFVGRRDYFNQWELRRNDVIDDSDTSSRTLDVWSDLQLYKKSNGYDYHCSYDNIILNTQNSPTSSQFPYLLGSSAIVQYWDDVRIIPLDSNNDIVTSGNLTTWYDAGIGKETYQIDVHATTPANTNYTAWYRQNGTGEFVQVGGVYTDSNTIVLSPRYQNTDVRIVLTGNQTATPELISITFYTQSEINGINLPNITSWCNNKTNNNSLTLTVNTSEPVKFNVTANQTIETWNWYKDNVTQQTNNFDNYTTEFGSVGPHSIQVNATNGNGTSDTIIWTVTVQALTGAPNITSWCNNKTNNNSITLTVNTSEPVKFNVTANQTIETWNWYKDNVTQPTNNFDNYTTDFGTGGHHTIQVNATNGNGTSDTIIWTVTVQALTGAPNITSWCNNKTNNNSITLTVNTSEPVRFNASANQTIETWNWYKDNVTQPTNNCDNYTTEFGSVGPHSIQVNATNGNGTSDTITWFVTVQAQAGAPNITAFAPVSPVNDTVGNWRTFNVSVNQTVNVTWYLNETAQEPKNESVTAAKFSCLATVVDVHNVSAVAENENGTAMQTWSWNVSAAQEKAAPSITAFAPVSPVNDTVGNWRTFNVSVNQTVNVTWYLNETAQEPKNESVTAAKFSCLATVVDVHNISAVAENENGTAMQTWSWNVSAAQEKAAPSITAFAPVSPVNDTVGNWRTFNVSVNQTVNVTWYLNETAQEPKNESVSEAKFSCLATVVDVHNASAVAENENGTAMQTWSWNVSAAQEKAAPNITAFATATSQVNDTIGDWRLFNVSVNQTVNVTWYLNGTAQEPKNESVSEANLSFCAAEVDVHNVSAVAEN